MTTWPNERGAGKGEMPVLLHAGRARPALPDRVRWAMSHYADRS